MAAGWRGFAAACVVAGGLLSPGEAAAQMALDGTYIDAYYGSIGTWNNPSTGRGLQISNGSRTTDVTYPGSPWQQIAWEYTYGGVGYTVTGNNGSATWTTSTASNLSSGTSNIAYHVYTDGRIKVEKTETWADGDKYIAINFVVTNTTASSITSFRLAHGMDPDHDVATYANYSTYNDIKDLNGDGKNDWTSSVGPSSGWSVGYGVCDVTKQTLGHTAAWETDADLPTLTDYNGSSSDYAMHIRHAEGTIASGGTASFGFIMAWDTTESGAQAVYAGSSCSPTADCDADGDGYDGTACGGTDCDDTNPAVYPGATETCNSIDDDCDGSVDEGLTSTYYRDADADGYGDVSTSTSSCTTLTGYVTNDDDCDDGRSSVNPAASERCNGRDDDCDGTIDESDAVDVKTWYADADGDGYGDPAVVQKACTAPRDYVSNDDDCNDGNSSIYPGATEVPYDGIDQDCDGADVIDVDGDGYAADATSGGTDCNDADSDVHPGAAESADGQDQDCDGTVDEATDWYDDDGDGFTQSGGDCDDAWGDASPAGIEECNGRDDDCDGVVDEDTECSDDDGDGYRETDGDCNDADPDVAPGEVEVSENGVDDDCDGLTDFGSEDPDGDGYTRDAGDCADADAAIHPGAPELEDGLDNDCDGVIDEGTAAYDDDGDGFTENDGDCWDGDEAVHPGASEAANGIDDDCDGTLDESTASFDDDGDGWSEAQGDCDDDDATVSPSTAETYDGRDEDCDGTVDEFLDDADLDGASIDDGDCDDTNGWVHPSAPEMCDNIDNDCDGEVDELCGAGEAEVEEGGCGCAGAGAPSALWWVAVAGLVARRRR